MSSNNLKLFLIFVIAAVLLFIRSIQVFGEVKPVGRQVKITGKIDSEPVVIGQSQYFSIGEIRAKTNIFPKYHFGDVVEIIGTPNNQLLISYPVIKKVGENKGFLSHIFAFRQFLISKASQLWPQPEASLLIGIILGQDTIPAEFRQVLINTGTIHVVVVSGQNVAMIAGFVTTAFAKLFKRRTLGLLVICSIIFYVLLTGSQPPTVRAAIMGILVFIAKITGRENWDIFALAITSYVMLFFNPHLVKSVSLQLSVAATFGILFATPVLEKLFDKFPKIVTDSLSITLAAWIFTAPIIAFYFAKFTPITLFANLLILPTIPFLMVAGAVSLLISPVNLFLGWVFAQIPFAVAVYFTFVTEKLSQIPFATISLPSINIFMISSFYVFVILIIKWSQRKYLAKN